jgi:hypothetical protein
MLGEPGFYNPFPRSNSQCERQRTAQAQAREAIGCLLGQMENGGTRWGDKGKKDKDKARKQKIKKQAQTAKTKLEKLPTKLPT